MTTQRRALHVVHAPGVWLLWRRAVAVTSPKRQYPFPDPTQGPPVTDLYVAIAIVGLVSVGALILALVIGARVSRPKATTFCVAVVGLIVAHVLWVTDRPWVAKILPVSSVIVLGNALPPLVAMLAGLAWRLIPGNVVRRVVLL